MQEKKKEDGSEGKRRRKIPSTRIWKGSLYTFRDPDSGSEITLERLRRKVGFEASTDLEVKDEVRWLHRGRTRSPVTFAHHLLLLLLPTTPFKQFTNMPRVPYRYPAPGTDSIADVIRQRRGERGLTPLDGMLLNSPQFANGWNSLLGAVRTGMSLKDDLREAMVSTQSTRKRSVDFYLFVGSTLRSSHLSSLLLSFRSSESQSIIKLHSNGFNMRK